MSAPVPHSPASPALFSGAVLAGGASTRMGTDKARLPFANGTLLDHQLATLRTTGAAPLFIAGRPERPYAAPDATFLPDAPDTHGPLAGLLSALAVTTTDHLAVLAVDLPRLPASHYITAARAVSASPDHTWVPRLHGRFEPLAALYARAHLPFLQAAAARREWSLQLLLADLERRGFLVVHDIVPAEAPDFANWNHPSDLP